MLSLTPPVLHSLHSICSGGVSVSGGVLGLFSLDVCMCQQGGEVWFLREPKTCWAQGFESAYMRWELHLWGGNAFQGEFLLCLAPGFLVTFAWLCRALPLSLRSHACVWLIASSHCPCLRESISAWSSDLFLLLSSFCHLFKFSLAERITGVSDPRGGGGE